jgi:Flp pilus assembly pilin Flp
MIVWSNLRSLVRDTRGAAMIEFAILGPIIIALLVGVLLMGLQLQSYNALKSIAYDVNRYTVVEYQKSNDMTTEQVRQIALATARSSPYLLSTDNFSVAAVEKDIGMTGAKEIEVTMTYRPPALLGGLKIGMPKMSQVQAIIVPGDVSPDGGTDGDGEGGTDGGTDGGSDGAWGQ